MKEGVFDVKDQTEPAPVQTDNEPRPEDGPQDVSQDPDVIYGDGGEDDGSTGQ